MQAKQADSRTGTALVLLGPARREIIPDFPLPVWVVAVGISIGMGFRAFDGLAGNALSAMINSSLLYAAIVRQPPTRTAVRKAAPVLALLLGAGFWGVVATLHVSGGVLPDYSFGKLLSLVSALCALLLGAMMARGRDRRRGLLDWLLLVNGVLLLTGLVFRELGVDVLLPYWSFERAGRYTGLAANANVTAVVAACSAVIAFSRLTGIHRTPVWAPRWAGSMTVNLPLFALSAGVVVITGSRTVAALLAVVLLLYLLRWRFRRRVSAGRVAAVGATVLLALVIAAAFSDVLRARFDMLGEGWADRVMSWGHLWDIFLQQPLYGYGLGSFPALNAHFLTTPHYAQANWAVNAAHNVALQMLLQAGVPYFALIVGACIIGTRQVARVLRGRWIRDSKTILVLVLMLLCSGMVDLTLDMPAPLSLCLFLTGLLWGQALDRREIPV